MVLKVINLTKKYNIDNSIKSILALDGINFKVNKGEFIAIMGPSGSGKTTLLNILSGLNKATKGNVFIDETDITNLTNDQLCNLRRKKVGYIFQDFNLMDSLTVKENIALPLILDKVQYHEINKRVNQLIDYFDISSTKDMYPYNISGGQKQRVAAARALITNPSIIFADEPTGNLDSKSSNNIMNMIKNINKEKNSTILMVTHDPFAASFADKIIFIKDGQIVTELISNGDRKEFLDIILENENKIRGLE